MSVTWPGPGRALQCHLDLFAKVDRAHDWIELHQGRGVTATELINAPATFRQRLALMTSMADTLGFQVVADGKTVATQRDDASNAYSQFTVARGVGLVATEWDVLNRGETHYVSHHIMASVAAAADLADDEPLFPTDLPCPRGLIVFEYPLLIPDLHPETGETVPGLDMPVRAIAWGQEKVFARKPDVEELEPFDGIWYTLYTDAEAWQSLFVASVKRELPDEYAAYEGLYSDTGDRDPVWCIDTSGWAFGKSWKRSLDPSPRESYPQGEIHDTVARVRRFILALFRFQWQRILVPQIYKPTRHEAKRASRIGMKLEDGYIKVLRLRRHVEMEARGEHVEPDPFTYDHQWLVRGHWRRQWYPSLGPARTDDGSFNYDAHRLVWIEPFVKGNPYGPLVVGHAVTAVVR